MSSDQYVVELTHQPVPQKRPSAGKIDSYLRTEPLEGLPRVVSVEGKKMKFGPSLKARRAAIEYCLSVGISPDSLPRTYAKIDKAKGARIAALYEDLESTPNDTETKASFEAFVQETLAQWRVIKSTGLQVEYSPKWRGGHEPYANPRLLILDVEHNNHLFVDVTRQAYGDQSFYADPSNPMLAEVPGELISGEVPLINDILRIVHDYFGHTREGLGFRAEGEYNAWRGHRAMYSPLARRAMTVELLAQTCWVNFGPYAADNVRANVNQTRYATQKIGLLPNWVSDDWNAEAEEIGDRLMG
ncbi:hypothetical protein E0Z10_g10034 [Xylaria hypoxylon]|uniref:Uncharacterized protein n=1 Tax=Xylaria hypoxylon TaxID=37992 RepID=A0A4Z0Y741_9PEZI|nr:hypothetical protein E0Z10_g10034 [Xylaria hypoxylon]